MKNFSKTMPAGMVLKKHYCHKCGARLAKNPHTRTVKFKDPEWWQHSKTMNGRMIGNIEVTEYDYICHECNHIVQYEQQLIIDKVQKSSGKKILSESELENGWETASDLVNRNRKIIDIITKILTFALIAAVMYFSAKK